MTAGCATHERIGPKRGRLLRPLSRPAEYGAWYALPVDPPQSELNLSQRDVQEGIQGREVLKAQYWHYPHRTWRAEAIAAHPEHAEAWRNWLLRRSWEAIASLNGCLTRWSP